MPAARPLPLTLGELRTSTQFPEARLKTRTIKDEMRGNLIARLQRKETLFPGIVGYEDTVVPQIVNAVLSQAELHSARACAARPRAAFCARSLPCSTSICPTSPAARFATIPIGRSASDAAI